MSDDSKDSSGEEKVEEALPESVLGDENLDIAANSKPSPEGEESGSGGEGGDGGSGGEGGAGDGGSDGDGEDG